MDPEVKTAIFAELDHSVVDSNEKVNINQISQNWDLSFHECSEILQEWCKAQEKLELRQEFLVRGLDKNGVARICIVSKSQLDAVQKKFEKFHSSLFALEKEHETNSLDTKTLSEGKRISLPLECKIRTQDTILIEDDKNTPMPSTSKTIPSKKEPATPKKEPVTPKKNVENKNSVASMFANAKPKVEKVSPPQEKKSEGTSPIKPKSEVKTPTKGKNVKSTPTKRKANNSHANAAKMHKASIASFFGNVPAKKAPIKGEPVTPTKDKSEEKIEIEEIVDTQNSEEIPETPPVPDVPVEEENARKRSMTNESEDEVVKSSQTKSNPSKRFKSQEKKKLRKRGNRIMQMSDSSDEEEKENNVKESEEGLESEDKREGSEIESTPQKEPLAKKRRIKVKQQKFRTYEDENGYLVSEKYIEEVSCSDDEVEFVPDPKEEVKKVEKKPVQKAATKQGSITNFFGKK
uniref:DNA polymerase delta subunit 3 n=1 Tax=Tabanus bromius TaxID=304241 RepID=A0A0K8TTQ7_TABBR